MSQSDLIFLAVSLLGFAVIGYILFGLTKQKGGHARQEDDGRDHDGGDQHRPRGNLRRRRGGVVNDNDDDNGVDEDEGDDNHQRNQQDDEPDLAGMTKKEIAKFEKRRAKAQQREAMEAEREDRKEKEEARMELLRERELVKDEEFRVKEAERLRELEAEKQQRIDAYNHWKDPYPDQILTFPTAMAAASTSKAGSEGEKVDTERFITFIREAKVTSVNELCVLFRLPSLNCIELLKHLVKKGDICGVFVDDDQKFLYVDGHHAAAKVTSYANRHGSLSMTDMTELFAQ